MQDNGVTRAQLTAGQQLQLLLQAYKFIIHSTLSVMNTLLAVFLKKTKRISLLTRTNPLFLHRRQCHGAMCMS